MSDNLVPLIKWPGGKSSEIVHIEHMIPKYKRYIEPFLGGGAVFFNQLPESGAINDISKNLIDFYSLIKNNDSLFRMYLLEYNTVWESYKLYVTKNIQPFIVLFNDYKNNNIDDSGLSNIISKEITSIINNNTFSEKIILNKDDLHKEIERMATRKIKSTVKNEIKLKKDLSYDDLIDNLVTGLMSGLYMYFRNLMNEMELNKDFDLIIQHKIANFFFIREFCYGSMFRYNKKGEFNIPYGGISYNKKDFKRKIDYLLSEEVVSTFNNISIENKDFEDFINGLDLNNDDFIFLDPPYDTDFSDYEGRSFDKEDQIRLSNLLKNTKAKFILIIKNTDFINSLYTDSSLNIYTFDKTYTYNVKSRNDRDVEHLIISNYEI